MYEIYADGTARKHPIQMPYVNYGREAAAFADIKILEDILWSEIGTKQDYEAEYGEKPLGEFVREIVGLDMTAAKEAFSEFLDEMNLDNRQIYFVNQIVEFIVHNGMMKDSSVLQETPFWEQRCFLSNFKFLCDKRNCL